MSKNTNHFANNFRLLRYKIGLSQEQLAEVLDMPLRRIQDYEYNAGTPQNKHVRKYLCDFYLVTEEELFNKKLN